MKRTHITFISFPAHPSIGPTLPIVSVLVRRGYRVTYVTSDQFASRVGAMGAEVIHSSGLPERTPLDGKLDERGNYQDQLTRLAQNTLEKVIPFYEENRPELIIYDHAALAGQILAKRWTIPAIQTSPCFAHEAQIYDKQVRDTAYRERSLTWSTQLNRFLARSGVPDRNFLFHRERLNIYLYPKELQPFADTIDQRGLFYAGRCAGEQPYYGSWAKGNTDGKQIAFVATSTLYVQGPEYFRMCIEALAGPKWHVLVSIGDTGDPAWFDPLPPGVEIIQHTSHVKILPHVSLFVCLGGIVTTAEALYHGVPLIVTTHGFPELEYQAENIVRLGLGLHLGKNDLNVDSLRGSAILISESDAIPNRVREVQRLVRRAPGAEETVNRIEEHLEAVAT